MDEAATDPVTRYLRERGENISTLAARMGKSPSTLTRPLRGERNPSISLAKEVERATNGGITAAQFIEACINGRIPTPEAAR